MKRSAPAMKKRALAMKAAAMKGGVPAMKQRVPAMKVTARTMKGSAPARKRAPSSARRSAARTMKGGASTLKRGSPAMKSAAGRGAVPKRTAAKAASRQPTGGTRKRPAAQRAGCVQRPLKAQRRAAKSPINSLGIAELEDIPTVFEFKSNAKAAYGLFVDDTRCMMGDEDGLVASIDRETGEPKDTFRLPDGVKCIVGDGSFLYVGTNKGAIFDLTAGRPRLVAEVEGFSQLLWIDICDGLIAASDDSGHVGLLNCEGEIMWQRKTGGEEGWMCRMDDSGIYYGANNGVRKYDRRGELLWSCDVAVDVAFGVQTSDHVWPIGLVPAHISPERALMLKIDKATGNVEGRMQFCGIDSCSVSPDGTRAYDAQLAVQPANMPRAAWKGAAWKKARLRMNAIFSQHMHGTRLYAVGCTPGTPDNLAILTCYDLSEDSLKAVVSCGSLKRSASVRTWTDVDRANEGTVDDGQDAKEATSADGCVLVRCVLEGGKVRVRVESAGYDTSLNVQFPRAFRKDGAAFVVDSVELAASGDFYRCRGEPRRFRA